MKKANKHPKRLLLSTETVRTLQPLDERQLQAAAGGRPACPNSIVKIDTGP